ncbi:MAG: AAA family ATPase [Deltaproteobacteria bacterium]|nr:AAA family ATPase [Deltaproteobacteria bacterium]
MAPKGIQEVPVAQLRWRLDPATLPFNTTDEIEPIKEIIGQDRALEAFRFGLGMEQNGYNVFVTGLPGTGRMTTVRKMLDEMTTSDKVPDDLCYVNNFTEPEAPTLLYLKPGMGKQLKKDVEELITTLKKDVPKLFESEEYLKAKKEVLVTYEEKAKKFFKDLGQRVKEQGFALVDVQMGGYKRPEVVPIVDEQPVNVDQLEAMTEKGRFPKEEFLAIKAKQQVLREEIDRIFLEMKDMQEEMQKKLEDMDRVMFLKSTSAALTDLNAKYDQEKVQKFLQEMIDDLAKNLTIFRPAAQQMPAPVPGMMFIPVTSGEDSFQPYQINLLVDNSEQKSTPIIIETNPTYRNVFGAIERSVDRSGLWRTDFMKIKVGAFVKANGGYLVINLLDAIVEPGVWPALKRSLKNNKLEIQTYDPFYLFTTSGIKPEPIEINVKVVLIGDPYIYHLLLAYDPDFKKIFKVRADFETSMKKDDEAINQYTRFIKEKLAEEKTKPFDRTAVAAIVEEGVRMTGRQEKLSTRFHEVTNLIREANFWASRNGTEVVSEKHVDQALAAKIRRSGMVEEHIQEAIDRGTIMIDTAGAVVGQVNGLAVYDMGEYSFGKPNRITATTSMGRSGVINIEREADMSGSTHNKGVLILSGYLRKRYAQDKPLTMSASIAFEQSYGGIDGDSASSTELYAILSSLAGLPLRQDLAVTGSVNQKGEIQPIGGVNQKIEGFFDVCKARKLSGTQGVVIPHQNVSDLMLRKDVVEAVKENNFHIYPVKSIDEGIELLTGIPAGEIKADGIYPEGSVNALVNAKLVELAKGLKAFGESKEEEAPKAKKSRKKETAKNPTDITVA